MRQEDRDFGLAIATVCTFVDRGYAAARPLARLGIDFTATITQFRSRRRGFSPRRGRQRRLQRACALRVVPTRLSLPRPRPRPRLSLQPTLYARRDARRRVASPAPSRRRRRT